MKFKFMQSALVASDDLGPRQIRVRASTGVIDRVGDELMPDGCFARSGSVPFILDHEQKIKAIVGRASIEISNGEVNALVTFLPEGVSSDADDACMKYKSGFATDVSVGFDPIDGVKTKTGVKFTKWEILELSGVVVGCNQEAVTTEKAIQQEAETPMKNKGIMKFKTKGLYAVGQLANLLAELGWLEDYAEWEAEIEGDGSPVPAMLHEALSQLGNALIAMTIEEVSEMLGEEQGEATKAIKTKLTKAFGGVMGSLGIKEKAGAAISKANQATLESACKAILEGHDAIKALVAAGEDDTSEEDTQKSAVQVSRKRQSEALSLVHN